MKKERVVVAMSGGVDSSLAAALLLEQGYDVVGMTMRLSDETRAVEPDAPSSVEDARHVADVLGISHQVVDFTETFEHTVVDYFLDAYLDGRTPNPCVVCNHHIKFGGLLRAAEDIGAHYIATGHYARIDRDEDGVYHLRKGMDHDKDQSYVLYHLNQEKLARVIFPLGNLRKSETRRMAEEYGLPVAHKTESQEICFVPNDDYKAYLREHRPGGTCCGDIVDSAGNVLGKHDGVAFYTIGQRKGLGIAASQPLYVTALDAAKNQVIVGAADAVYAQELIASDLNWTMWDTLAEERTVEAKIRYGKRLAAARVMQEGNRVRVCFTDPQRAVTPGQSVVFYENDIVLGGGIIDKVIS